MDLDTLREKIDTIDREIIEHLNQRIGLALQIGDRKREAGAEFYVPAREEQIFQKLAAISDGPVDHKAIRAIYREIISVATALQKPIDAAYLGPEATYTHQAAMNNFGSAANYLPLGTIPDVFSAVQRGEADYGVVPIENSTEGAVFHSFDMLMETDLKIVAQVYMEISHCLISQSPIENINVVISKDNALGQCRQWLGRKLPQVEQRACDSTAQAVLYARENPTAGAIASRIASDLYDVPIAAVNIQDKTDNVTRFLVIGKSTEPSTPLGGGQDKTSLVLSLHDEPGALLRALTPFSSRGLNLCKIESRPSRQKLWDYYFFVDVIGHINDEPLQEALHELQKSCPMVKWLGSYPNTGVRLAH